MSAAAALAKANGFKDEFEVLRAFRVGGGDPRPEDLLQLPVDFRKRALGMKGTDLADLEAGMTRLWELVDEAPKEEAERLRMAFNFNAEHGSDVWTKRVREFAAKHGRDEKRIREAVDADILQLLLRTRAAAEKHPEVLAPIDTSGGRSTLSTFFDQDYVRNSDEFVKCWSSATTVDICGFGHNRMLVSYSSEIVTLLTRGGRMRVLLQDPDGRAVLDANFRSSTPKASEEEVRHQHRAGLATLSALRGPTGPGIIEARAYDILPPFTAYFFDGAAQGVAFVWFWSWRQASSWRPGLIVKKSEDVVWFDRFYSQFAAMWADEDVSKPVLLDRQ